MTVAEMRAMGFPDPGVHPSGEPFVTCEVTRESRDRTVHYGPPPYPSRRVLIDLETEETRERTATEWAEELASYERATAEWKRTGGLFRVKGPPPREHGRFVCASGRYAEGDVFNGVWEWNQIG